MTTFGQDEPREQNFYGSGPSFGGDNKGIVNNVLLDPKTRAYLADMSEKAPELAGLLRRALHDGFISPDVAQALLLAAQNINEDVAEALLVAGRNINEDVAVNLMVAGQNINDNVAEKFVCVNKGLGDTARDLDRTLSSLRKIVEQLSDVQGRSVPDGQMGPARIVTGAVSRNARIVTQPALRSQDNWRFRLRLVSLGSGVGLLTAAILASFHLGVYAAVAGGVILVLPIISWLGKQRR